MKEVNSRRKALMWPSWEITAACLAQSLVFIADYRGSWFFSIKQINGEMEENMMSGRFYLVWTTKASYFVVRSRLTNFMAAMLVDKNRRVSFVCQHSCLVTWLQAMCRPILLVLRSYFPNLDHVTFSKDAFYCAFHEHANCKIQKPPSQLRFWLPSIIIEDVSIDNEYEF